MHRREKDDIVGNDGHYGAVIDRLVKHPFPVLHEYIRILFESGGEGLDVVLWLWCWVVDLLGDLPPFLLQVTD